MSVGQSAKFKEVSAQIQEFPRTNGNHVYNIDSCIVWKDASLLLLSINNLQHIFQFYTYTAQVNNILK